MCENVGSEASAGSDLRLASRIGPEKSPSRKLTRLKSQYPRMRAGSTGRCNTTWYKSYFLKGGVHEPRETMEAIFGPEGRYVEPLESGAVVALDWSSVGQGPCGNSASVGALWGNRSGCSSPFAAGTHPGRTRRHLSRNR